MKSTIDMDVLSMAGKIVILAIIGVTLLFIFVPAVRQLGTRALTSSEKITLPPDDGARSTVGGARPVELVTLLGFDSIPAILNPRFVTPLEAEDWMEPDEQVLGLSINGEHRAYPIRMLSRHEIVNDVVGDVPVAVTW